MDSFTFRRLRATVYRATSYDTPLWVFPNRRPGRWSDPADETIAQYFCLDPAAPYAELVRHEDLRTADDLDEARVGLWELRVDEGAILDISNPERVSGHALDWDDLVADDWSVCQQVGRGVRASGGRGLLAPSAALPGSLTLVLFGARSELSWERAPRLSIQVPARELVLGAPRLGVARATRYFGDPYPADVEHASVAHLLDD